MRIKIPGTPAFISPDKKTRKKFGIPSTMEVTKDLQSLFTAYYLGLTDDDNDFRVMLWVQLACRQTKIRDTEKTYDLKDWFETNMEYVLSLKF